MHKLPGCRVEALQATVPGTDPQFSIGIEFQGENLVTGQ